MICSEDLLLARALTFFRVEDLYHFALTWHAVVYGPMPTTEKKRKLEEQEEELIPYTTPLPEPTAATFRPRRRRIV